MTDPKQCTVVAKIVRPQGRKGEVLSELLTDFPERFAQRRSLLLRFHQQSELQPITLRHHWLPTGKNAGRIVLHFEGIDSISAAEQLAGAEVLILDSERAPLDDDAFYVSDLVGCTVMEEEHVIGIIQDVHFPADSHGKRIAEAAPILVLETPKGDELLIPLVKAFLQQPDLANKRIQMQLPPGLLEING